MSKLCELNWRERINFDIYENLCGEASQHFNKAAVYQLSLDKLISRIMKFQILQMIKSQKKSN